MNDLFNQFQNYYGQVWPNGTYDIFRPNYESRITAANQLAVRRSLRCDKTTSSNLPEPSMPGVEYYSIFGCTSLAPGDIISPNPRKSGVPRLTMQNCDEHKEFVAFRTDRVGQITMQTEVTPHYTNVLFDFVGIDGPAPNSEPAFQGVPDVASRRAVMQYRSNIKTDMYLLDDLTKQWFQIVSSNVIGSTLELYLKVTG